MSINTKLRAMNNYSLGSIIDKLISVMNSSKYQDNDYTKIVNNILDQANAGDKLSSKQINTLKMHLAHYS